MYDMKPIGYLQSPFKFKNGTPRQATVCHQARASLTIDKAIFNNPEHSLEGLESFTHVWILFVFHQNNNAYTKAKVKPPRLNGRKVGLFSTRSPYRPNNIGLTLARIEGICDATLTVSGVDILDGTPVLDLKPYIPQYDCPAIFTSTDSKVSGAEGGLNVEEQRLETNTIDENIAEEHEKIRKFGNEASAINSYNVSDVSEDASYRDSDCSKTSEVKRIGGKLTANPSGQETCIKAGVNGSFNEQQKKDTKCVHDDKNKTDGDDFIKSELKEDYECGASNSTNTHVELKTSNEDNQKSEHVGKISQALEDDIKMIHAGKVSDIIKDAVLESASSQHPGEIKLDKTDTAGWIAKPPISTLSVRFTPMSEQQLKQFSPSSCDSQFKLQHLKHGEEAREAIVNILHEDPRSTYRRKQCADSLYYFTVDVLHVTAWFDQDDCAVEVVRVKPAATVDQCKHRFTN